MAIEKWYCEACNTLGEIDIAPHTNLWRALELLGQCHNAVSPECPFVKHLFMDTAVAKMLILVTDEKALRKKIGQVRWNFLNRIATT